MSSPENFDVPDEQAFEPYRQPDLSTPLLPAAVPDRPTQPDESQPERPFADLTLAEVLGRFWRAPRRTYHALVEATSIDVTTPRHPGAADFAPPRTQTPPAAEPVVESAPPAKRSHEVAALDDSKAAEAAPPPAVTPEQRKRARVKVGLYATAALVAFWGCVALVSGDARRVEAVQLQAGLPYLIAGMLLWLGVELYDSWPGLRARWRVRRLAGSTEGTLPPVMIDPGVPLGPRLLNRAALLNGVHPLRVFAALGTVIFAVIAWQQTRDNFFRPAGFYAWVASIVLVVMVFAPLTWQPRRVMAAARRWWDGLRLNWVTLALLAIIAVGAVFRLHNLDAVPPEMTSDHIEKLLDSQRVLDGQHLVFFPNNGGREGFQMYAMALFSQLPGLGINFTTLKLLAVIEGLITIPVLFWMGREVMGDQNRRLGIIVGLVLAALVAVSYWHVTVTRLALRIILTPLVAALLLIFLGRGMRYNRRGDFLLAGLVLGFGLYTYQAVRMLPLVVLVGVALGFLYYIRQAEMRVRFVANLAVLVLVSFVIFVPLFRFSYDYPNLFWMRTAGRLFGDDVIQEIDAEGNLVNRDPTIEDRLEALGENLPQLATNIRNAFLMYNWKGDVAWINGVPNQPVMDPFTGAWLIVGAAAWLGLIFRRRDPVLVLVPLMVFIMLLPSALAIAASLENPSATRASGSLPPVYLVAALPLALLILAAHRAFAGRLGTILAAVFPALTLTGALLINTTLYFEDYPESYLDSWRTHSVPGAVLAGFATSDGGYGNAFMLHFPHWLDHRIVGLEAGIIDWPNGIVSLGDIPNTVVQSWRCEGRPYPLDPDSDLLFFYNIGDEAAEAQFQEWFPQGRVRLFDDSQREWNYFKTYRVPALGETELEAFAETYSPDSGC